MKRSKWVFCNNTFCFECGVPLRRGSLATPYCPYCGSYMENYRDEACDCYRVFYGVPRCFGTKEIEECSCEGFKNKCNFYKEGE